MVNVGTVVAAVAVAGMSIGLAGCGSSAGGDGGGGSSRAEPWSLVSASGRQVVIRYLMGGCKHDPTISHRESSSRVVITVRVRISDGICPADLILRTARVTLADPLGRRQLIDGSTGSPPPTGPPLAHLPTGSPLPPLPTGPSRGGGGPPPGH